MATRIAAYITNKMLTSSVIEEDDKELYFYGFFLLISGLFYFLITLGAGFLTGVPCESVIFYIVFMLLRAYAGGIHAKTEVVCTVLTALALTASVCIIKVMKQMNCNEIPLLMLASGSLCILLFSPLDSKEKPLEKLERKKYRTVCVSIVLFCITVALIAHRLSLNAIFCPVVCGVCLEGILLITGKLCNFRNESTYKV